MKLAEKLDHPHIARRYSLESHGEYHVIPMEFVYGQNLSEKISEGPSNFDFVMKVAIQAATVFFLPMRWDWCMSELLPIA